MKLNVPAALVELFTDRSKTCYNATGPMLLKGRRCRGGLSSAAMLESAPAREDKRLYTMNRKK